MNVKSPKSYKDLLIFSGEYCSTFRESTKKRELLFCDNNLTEYMSEASTYQMTSRLRHLFVCFYLIVIQIIIKSYEKS